MVLKYVTAAEISWHRWETQAAKMIDPLVEARKGDTVSFAVASTSTFEESGRFPLPKEDIFPEM